MRRGDTRIRLVTLAAMHLRNLRTCGLALALAAVSACTNLERMPPTPNLHRDGSGSKVLAALPEDMQRPEMDILYVTDRSQVDLSDRGPEYGYGRATSMNFGTAIVSLDPSPTWSVCTSWRIASAPTWPPPHFAS